MPVFEVIGGLDVWGNAVDGYEVNNQHDKGFATLRYDWPERRIIEALMKQGHLGGAAVEMFDNSELRMDEHDEWEVVEREQAWAHSPPGEEPRYIDAGDGQTAEQVAEDDGEGPPEEYELVEGWRPVLILNEQIPENESRKVPFWRDNVLSGSAATAHGDSPLRGRVKANVELRIDPEAPARPTGGEQRGMFLVDVWVDGEFFGSRDFPFRCGLYAEEIGLAAPSGEDPDKYQALVYAPADCKEMEVALDAFWENGGEAPKRYLKVKPYAEVVQGRQQHYPELIQGAYRDGLDDGSVNWDHDYTAADIAAIRRGARAWARALVTAEGEGEVGRDFVVSIQTDYPELSAPQVDAIYARYVDGVISGLTASALAFSAQHGDQLLRPIRENDDDDRGRLFIAVPRDARPGMPFNGSAYVLLLDDNVLDENGGAVRRWHDAGVEDWEELGVDVDLDDRLEPANFILPSRGVMTDSRGEFDVYELQDISIA